MRIGKKSVILCKAFLLLGPCAALAAEPASPYITLGLGASFLEDLSVSGPAGNTPSLIENVGALGTAGYGYAFGNGFRAELEFGYRGNSGKNITLPGVTPTPLNSKTNAAALSYMANALYNFDLHSPWSPYLGFGLGAANVRISNVGHDWPFAWQAMTGVEYAVNPALRLGVGYKFLGTDGLKFNTTNVQSHANYHDHAVLLTLRWSLAAPRARPAVAVPPPPPAEPAPAALPLAPLTFDVYFDLNEATLTPQARTTVQQAATAALQRGQGTRINVVGHTDTTGAPQYNAGLSQRRAEAVRAELLRNGVPADEIVTAGRGKSDLALPTADGVREPRNRRVVIMLQSPGV